MKQDAPRGLGLGVAGYGMIGRLHTMNYRQIPFVYPGALPRLELRSICTSREESARAAQSEAGFATAVTDTAELVGDPSIDVIDVSLPNNLHRPLVEAAIAAGKHVYCEKPLAGTIEDARAIRAAVERASRAAAPGGHVPRFGMVFQYRFFPALMKAQEMIREGKLGRIFTYRAEYLHTGYQNPDRPLSWRMKKDEGGSGALGDLGSHVIDLVRFLLGEFESVQGHLETFVKERPVAKGATEKGQVTVDDVAWFRARMADGAVGTVEASRFATGTLDDLRVWIYGEKGALHFDLMDASYLQWFDESLPAGSYGGERGWQKLQTVQYYPGAQTPPARAPIGWNRAHTENQYQFLKAVTEGREPSPGILDGLRVQLVMDAVERSAAEGGRSVPVETE
jgi:predicted dehydrogenase